MNINFIGRALRIACAATCAALALTVSAAPLEPVAVMSNVGGELVLTVIVALTVDPERPFQPVN